MSGVRHKGFTIVELIVIISVVSILAVLGAVSYGAWQKSVYETAVKNDLRAAAAQLEDARNFSSDGSYPTVEPDFSPSENVEITYSSLTEESYCLDGSSTTDETVEFYLYSEAKDQGPLAGTCEDRPDLSVPSAPTGVTVTGASSTSAQVSWSAVADATGYTVQCASDAGFVANPQQATRSSGVGTLSQTVTGLTAGEPAYCRVKASNNSGSGGWSALGHTTLAPATPTGVFVTKNTFDIVLSWDSVLGATSYTYQYSTASNFTSPTSATTTALTASIYAPSSNTLYYLRVKASNGIAESAWSTSVSITSPNPPFPP